MNEKKQMRMRDFLAKDSLEKTIARDHEAKRDTTQLCKLWVAKYREIIGEMYLITPKEKMLMRRLIEEYGKEKVQLAMDYYMANYSSMKKPEGWPSIPALYGFRRQIVLEATKGKVQPKKQIHGQYDSSKMAADDWG